MTQFEIKDYFYHLTLSTSNSWIVPLFQTHEWHMCPELKVEYLRQRPTMSFSGAGIADRSCCLRRQEWGRWWIHRFRHMVVLLSVIPSSPRVWCPAIGGHSYQFVSMETANWRQHNDLRSSDGVKGAKKNDWRSWKRLNLSFLTIKLSFMKTREGAIWA